MTSSGEVRAASIRAVAAQIGSAVDARDRARVDAIRRARARLVAHMTTWASEVQAALQEEVDQRFSVGCPPSYVTLAGLGHLERPLNRLFAWWAKPDGGHGLSRAFLVRLARRAGADTLAVDLERGEDATVHVEAAVDDSGSMPDLLVKTSGGALLLENKHGSSESGNRQYDRYLALLQRWAANVPAAQRRAVLSCRSPRETPARWSDVVLHREIAALFRDLAKKEKAATTWAKVSALVTAEAFEDREVGALLADAKALLDRKGGPLATRIREMRELAEALAARPVVLPWRDDEDAG